MLRALQGEIVQSQGHSMRLSLRSIPLSILLVLAPVALADAAETRSVTVTGEASVFARPNVATLSAGVVSEASTAADALAANSGATQAVIDRVKAQSVEARDIQTSGFSLQPVYAQTKDDNAAPKIVGYRVSNTVSVRIRDLAQLGAVMDKVVAAGANTMGGIEFQVSDQSALADDARKAAFADAKRKADLYAAAAGATLGPVMTLSEQTAGGPPPRPMYRMEAAAAAVPVETGENEIRVEVSATFLLQ
jgi:uncharacterized protein